MFASPIKLGRPRKELSFTANVDEIEAIRSNWMNQETRMRNAAGEGFRRVFRRSSPSFSINVANATEATVQKIMSLRLIDDEPLSFYFANSLAIYSERYLTDGLTTLTLDSSPMTKLGKAYVDAGGLHSDIIVPTGVFLTYDVGGAQGGTNYFSAYNAQTRVVTLSPSPGAIGTVVFVNWNYRGALVHMSAPRVSHGGGMIGAGGPLWDVSLDLEGV